MSIPSPRLHPTIPQSHCVTEEALRFAIKKYFSLVDNYQDITLFWNHETQSLKPNSGKGSCALTDQSHRQSREYLPPAVNHVGNSLYNAYQAKDGKRLQFVMLETDRSWFNLCKASETDDPEKPTDWTAMSGVARAMN